MMDDIKKLTSKEYNKIYYLKKKEERKIKKKQYYEEHKEEVEEQKTLHEKILKEKQKERNKKYREEHKEERKIKKKQYYEEHKEEIKEQRKQYCEEHKKERNEYQKERYYKDLEYKILCNLRSRIGVALKKLKKSATTMELVGCSIEELKLHLEKQFKPGMTWENHGKWHIDHIRPCASFNLLLEEEQKKCFHHTNLQPLWAEENINKSNL